MLRLEDAILTAARHAGDATAVLAAPYDLSETLCRDLVDRGCIGGYVANGTPGPGERDLRIMGWWIDRDRGLWFLRGSIASTVILLGAATHQAVDAALLTEARRKGVRRILVAGGDGVILREIDVDSASMAGPQPAGTASRVGDLSYGRVFADIFGCLGHRYRLPPDGFDPNRVLLVVGSLGPGGAERQVAYTAAGLARRGACEVHVACRHTGHPADFYRPYVEAAGARLCEVGHGPEDDAPAVRVLRRRLAAYDALGACSLLESVLGYVQLIRTVRPRVVHTWMDYCNVLAGIAAELVGVPVLVLGGRSVAPDKFPGLFQPYMRPGYLSLLRRRDVRFLNNSRTGATDYARWLDLPGESIEILRNGFEFPAETSRSARAAVRREHGISEDAVVVGTITRFSEEKRPRLFIDMARHLHARHPETRFLAFGSGPMLAEMRAYAEAGGLANIVMLPGITEDGWSALAAMDVFALTSRMEGLPNVLVEAQASALPVVCTGVGGMEETFIDGETGFSVRAATAEALADAVSSLVADPELHRRVSERAFRHARDAFAVERMLAQTQEAYDGRSAAHAV